MRAAVLAFAVTGMCPLAAMTYYVDSENGDDAKSGTEEGAAWKSLKKANTAPLTAGDKLLFHRGSEWAGELVIARAGTAQDAIYVGAYGDPSRARPLIQGGGAVPAAVLIKSPASFVTVEGLAVTNFDGKDLVDGVEGDRCGIKAGTWGETLRGIRILHNEISQVEGYSNHPTVGPPRGTTLDPKTHHQYAAAALLLNATTMTDVLLDGNEVHDCTGTGILAFAFTNVTGLLIQNNRVRNVGSDGIEILNATRPVVQDNTCIGAGNNSGVAERGPGVLGYHGLSVGGMWATSSSDVLFQRNDCEDTHVIKYDGEAWDFDMKLSGTCIYQYNFSRNNEGGFLLNGNDTRPGYRRICRFNISVNDGSRQGAGEGFFNGSGCDYYNNIFYRTDGKGFMVPDGRLSSPMGGTFENNIFYTTATADIAYATATRIFSHNCFYGHAPSGRERMRCWRIRSLWMRRVLHQREGRMLRGFACRGRRRAGARGCWCRMMAGGIIGGGRCRRTGGRLGRMRESEPRARRSRATTSRRTLLLISTGF